MRWFRGGSSRTKSGDDRGLSRAEALACRPVRNREVREERLESGELLLTFPLLVRPWLTGLARALGLQDRQVLTRKLQLDEMGSLTWTLMDGERSLADLVEIVRRKYGLQQRETDIAITTFLRELGRRGLIGFRLPRGRSEEPGSTADRAAR
jgi:Coenzyme PQQ synthesis protein D (PqqD)